MTKRLRDSQIISNFLIIAMIAIALFPMWILIVIALKNQYQFDVNR